MNATCIGAHDTDPPLAHHGLICSRCHGRLARALDDIATLYPLLEELLIPGSVNGGGARSKPGSRPACDLDVADLRDARGTVHAEVSGWARIVIEERQLAARPMDVEQAARLLTIHLDWISEQPWVGEALVEIGDAAWMIRRVCHDLPDPPIGTCPDVDPRGQRDTCGGPLRIVSTRSVGMNGGRMFVDQGDADAQISAVCSWCGSAWADADLPHILRIVQPTRRFPAPREWVAARYSINPGQLRMWINRGHVRSYSDHQVELFDVLARIQEG